MSLRDGATLPLILAALLGAIVGGQYLRATALLPYQQRAVGKSWEALDPGVRAVFHALLRLVGGGFLSLAAAMAWAAYEVHAHDPAAPWAALAIAVAGLGPTISATVLLRRFRPGSRPPTALAMAALALVGAGVALALLAPD